MSSIDLRDAEVQLQFTAIRKAPQETEREEIATQIATMYERSEDYSYGIFSRVMRFISESNDKEEKRTGLQVLCAVGPKIQGTARSAFVNKFHSPVFRLLENNQEEGLLPLVQRAYQVVLEVGGNRNDSAVESDLSACLAILQSGAAKEVRRVAAYAVLRILVGASPYIAFKKLLQKQRNNNLDNLSLVIAAAKVRSLRVRQAYLLFLEEYAKYIAEKKDYTFQKATFQRFYENYAHISPKETSEELNHLYLETIHLFLTHLNAVIPVDRIRSVLEYALEKIQTNRNPLIERSLIQILPKLAQKRPSDDIICHFLRFLRTIEGEAKIAAQVALNLILDNLQQRKEGFGSIYRDIIQQVLVRLRTALTKPSNYLQTIELTAVQLKTVDTLLRKFVGEEGQLVNRESLEQLVSYGLLLRLDEQTIRLVADIAKNNIHGLGRTLEIKFILTLSKILTGSARKVLRDPTAQFRPFLELLEQPQTVQYLENNDNKVKAIQALSQYRFREELRQIVGGFVRDRVLKYYLQWGTSAMKMASVEAAFFLYAKKGRAVANSQLLQILDKLLRVGLTDGDQAVRQKVFSSIARNFKRHEQFLQFFTQISLLSYLFQAVEDRNERIRLWALRIVCTLHSKDPSVLITPFLKKITYNCFYHLSSGFRYYPQKQSLIQSVIVLVEYAPSIIENHIDSLLQLLLNYLDDRNNYEGLQLLFFQLLRTLALALPDAILPYAHAFSRHLVRAMRDKLNTKNRLAALRTFVNVIRQCGYVVIPYFQVPALRQTLSFLIRSEIEEQSRNDLMRIIGALGAVDNLRYSLVLATCADTQNPQTLASALKRLGAPSAFLRRRAQMITAKADNAVDKQLKLYYDELILLENNKRLLLLGSQQSDSVRPTRQAEREERNQGQQSGNFHWLILKSLFLILEDKSLSEKKALALDVLQQLLEMMGSELQRDLPKVMETLLRLVRANEQVLPLVLTLGQKCDLGQFVGELVTYVISDCKSNDLVVRALALVTGRYPQALRHLMEPIVDRLHTVVEACSGQEVLMVKVALIYHNLKQLLEPYLTILLPQLLQKFFRKSSETTLAFIDFLMALAQCCSSLLQFMPLISHHFARLLSLCQGRHTDCKPCLRSKLCMCIVLFITVFKRQFISYLPMLHKAVLQEEDPPALYLKAIRCLENCSFGSLSSVFTEEQLERLSPEHHPAPLHKFDTPKYLKRVQGVEELIHEFDPLGKRIVDEDWVQWLRKTSILLLKRSPNVLLRSCSVLAEEYNQLGLELYHLSFYFFWEVLADQQKKTLVDNVRRILTHSPKPFLLVRKTFLSLAEFMSRRKCSFQLSSALLAECAGQSSCFAKQLYYRELQFQASPERTLEGLIDTYMRLGEPQNAYGLFKVAAGLEIPCQTAWYEKIGKYEQAYQAYLGAGDSRSAAQRIQCLSRLSDQQFTVEFAKSKNSLPSEVALLAVEAYAQLGQWDQCEAALELAPSTGVDKDFWAAVLNVRADKQEAALKHIAATRRLLYEQIPDLLSFSSTSEGFAKFVCLQQLCQLEEIVILRQRENGEIKPQERARLRAAWDDRLIGCSKNSTTYRSLSVVRSLLFNRTDYFEFYYQFCEIYLREKNLPSCNSLLNDLRSQLSLPADMEKLQMLQLLELKAAFKNNAKSVDLREVRSFLERHPHLNPKRIGELYYLAAMAHYEEGADDANTQAEVRELLQKSAQLMSSPREWYILSSITLEFAEGKSEGSGKLVELAVSALVSSLQVSSGENKFYLQGYLKLLSVLCKYSHLSPVCELFESAISSIPVEGWINVVPQMIAQLYQIGQESNFLRLLKLLLCQLGKQHPESVLFSLNFALKSKIAERTIPANEIMTNIKSQHGELAEEVETISNELGRAAIKLKEYWFDGVEAAWAAYNQNKDADQVVNLLRQICQTVDSRRHSNSELAFHQEFGQEVREGYNWLLRFERKKDPTCIAQVFEIFYGVYRKVKDSFENIRKVYLKNVAPFLVASKRYKSSIPGLYQPGRPCVKITGFCNELLILQSKQRPRKLTVFGDDGKQYNFLLKGREDLRLDQRVMQFFSLVNRFLGAERESLRRELSITRYSIIPLTVNTGLIGWVQNCDTLNELIKEYRASNKIRVYVEKELYQKMCPDYAYLPVINKLEIFKNGLQSTQGKDLQKILWLKSSSSEEWVERRNNYTCSLATMSMVGYILGLGDRHPSNIMLQRDSGKVVHIDFGDCFEVAALREKFPEKVPFRLTRMLQKAMGVPGINGIFRVTCEKVMAILRQYKQSLFGVLETFAQDPIISWRLTNENKDPLVREAPAPHEEVIQSFMVALRIEMQQRRPAKDQAELQDEPPGRTEPQAEGKQQINKKAVKALQRIKQKLRGYDFEGRGQLSVEDQVGRLIQEATSPLNICQSWPGWCPYW